MNALPAPKTVSAFLRRTVPSLAAVTALAVLVGACTTSARDDRSTAPARVVQAAPSGNASANAARVEARIADADAKFSVVRTARTWPSDEDRQRWRRDMAVASDARTRFEQSRGTADEGAALTAYEDAVAIAYAGRRAVELGDTARNRPWGSSH